MSAIKDHLVFASVLMVTLLSCAGIALPYPIMAPLFMSGQANGLNTFMSVSPEMLLGFAMAIYPLGIFIGGSFIGALSDSYGRKKLLVITLFISILGYAITAYAVVEQNYLLFIAARFFTGLCEGNISIARAIALDLGKTIDKTRAMSLVSAASFLGWLIGPLAGGYLAVYGAEVAFIAAGVAIFVCMVFVMLVINETHKVVNDKPFVTLLKSHNSLSLLKNPVVFQIFVFQFIFTLGLNAFYEFYPVWLVIERGFQASDIGNITAVTTVCMTLSSLVLVTKLKRMFGIKASVIGSLVVSAILLAIMPFTESTGMFVVFAFIGVSLAVYNGLLPVFASDIVSDVGNGALMGLLTVIFCISNAIIALVGSYALTLHPALPLFLGSGLVALSMVLFTRFAYSNVGYNVGADAKTS
ncbi:MAG: MFS transporter [Algicola sp.]|nr:MFS transporter [Algicola sp.]